MIWLLLLSWAFAQETLTEDTQAHEDCNPTQMLEHRVDAQIKRVGELIEMLNAQAEVREREVAVALALVADTGAGVDAEGDSVEDTEAATDIDIDIDGEVDTESDQREDEIPVRTVGPE